MTKISFSMSRRKLEQSITHSHNLLFIIQEKGNGTISDIKAIDFFTLYFAPNNMLFEIPHC